MTRQKQKKSKTHPRSKAVAVSRRGYDKIIETDGTYFLKLVFVVLAGTLWLKFKAPVEWLGIPLSGIPLGMLVGLICVNRFEKLQADRKIWYAMLVIIAIISYFVPAGIVI